MDLFDTDKILITTVRAELFDNIANNKFDKDLIVQYYRLVGIDDFYKQADDFLLELLNFDSLPEDLDYDAWFSAILTKDYVVSFYGDFLRTYFSKLNVDIPLEEKMEALDKIDPEAIPDGYVKKLYYYLKLEIALAIRPLDMKKVKDINEQLKRLL